MPKMLWIVLFAAGLLPSCATSIPDIKVVAPVEGIPGIAALAQQSNSDFRGRMGLVEWLDFLYARGPKDFPDPDNLGKFITLPAKGPAICVSSEDWQRNETALAALCVKGQCNYEQQKTLARMKAFREAASVIPK